MTQIDKLLLRYVSLALVFFSPTAQSFVLSSPPVQESSVKPGINDRWRSDDIDPLVETLENADRDIYKNRRQLAKLFAPTRGAVVADVGAGSGFMVEEFAQMVGPEGLVYAADINLKLLERIEMRARDNNVKNIRTVLSTDDSSRLPPGEIDLLFVCDTYHHFEYPVKTLQTLYRALKPGGELFLVEFKRIPGESAEWILDHVRDGREMFTSEIEAAGFELVREHEAPFLPRNYVLRFRKPSAG
jgi:predicted methyltransferase